MRTLTQKLSCLLAATTALAFTAPAHAEVEVSAYGGANWNFSSKTKLEKGGVTDDRNIDWLGKPFEMPPYWGVRATYWWQKQSSWGIAFDYTHAKSYADLDFSTDPTYSHLEFTDGNNLYTLNAMYRHKRPNNPWVYYGGAGVGFAMPHTEVELKAFPNQPTREYQVTGIAAQALAGVQYRFTKNWGVFGEGKISYAHDDSDLKGGGSLKTDIWSPHALAGISYSF